MTTDLEMSFIGRVISLFIIFNALGQIPVFIALLARYDHARQKKIIIRECLVALVTILIFTFFGEAVLQYAGISKNTIRIAGGLLLLLIGVTLIFPKSNHVEGQMEQEPFVFPLAIPGLAGPGTMTTVMVFSTQVGPYVTAAAFFLAWIPSFILVYSASYVKNYLGEKGLQATERLGGMLISFFGVEMFVTGFVNVVKDQFLS